MEDVKVQKIVVEHSQKLIAEPGDTTPPGREPPIPRSPEVEIIGVTNYGTDVASWQEADNVLKSHAMSQGQSPETFKKIWKPQDVDVEFEITREGITTPTTKHRRIMAWPKDQPFWMRIVTPEERAKDPEYWKFYEHVVKTRVSDEERSKMPGWCGQMSPQEHRDSLEKELEKRNSQEGHVMLDIPEIAAYWKGRGLESIRELMKLPDSTKLVITKVLIMLKRVVEFKPDVQIDAKKSPSPDEAIEGVAKPDADASPKLTKHRLRLDKINARRVLLGMTPATDIKGKCGYCINGICCVTTLTHSEGVPLCQKCLCHHQDTFYGMGCHAHSYCNDYCNVCHNCIRGSHLDDDDSSVCTESSNSDEESSGDETFDDEEDKEYPDSEISVNDVSHPCSMCADPECPGK